MRPVVGGLNHGRAVSRSTCVIVNWKTISFRHPMLESQNMQDIVATMSTTLVTVIVRRVLRQFVGAMWDNVITQCRRGSADTWVV